MNINKDKGDRAAQDEPEALKVKTSGKKEEASLTPQKEVCVIEKEKTEKTRVQLEEAGKMPFALLAKERKLTPARRVVLKRLCKWDDETRVTSSELEAAIRKHLKGEV